MNRRNFWGTLGKAVAGVAGVFGAAKAGEVEAAPTTGSATLTSRTLPNGQPCHEVPAIDQRRLKLRVTGNGMYAETDVEVIDAETGERVAGLEFVRALRYTLDPDEPFATLELTMLDGDVDLVTEGILMVTERTPFKEYVERSGEA